MDTVKGVYIPSDPAGEPKEVDIPFEYDSFKKLIGEDFTDKAYIRHKVLAFISTDDNESDKDEIFKLEKKIKGEIKNGCLLLGGDEEYVWDLNEMQIAFYTDKIILLQSSGEDVELKKELPPEG